MFTWRWGTPGRWSYLLCWGNPPVHIISHFIVITLTWWVGWPAACYLTYLGSSTSSKLALRLAKQQLCACITLFCTFRSRRCTTTTWKCLISRFVEDLNTRRQLAFFFSWTLIQSFRIQPPQTFANICGIKRDGISAIKFEAARIHFLSDVFVVVAVVVPWAP